jgi:hypothetical protein
MLDRRAVLRGTLAVATLAAASGHTPYRQWSVYRQKHLLIGCCRADPPTYPLAKRVAAVLAEWLPESRSRVSRAPDQERLASLITTGQLEVMMFSRRDATALNAGAAPFADFGPSPLTALFRFDNYLLVSRPDFPDRHAWLVARTLSERVADFDAAAPAGGGPLIRHPGATAYAAGAPEPAGPPTTDQTADLAEDDHSH